MKLGSKRLQSGIFLNFDLSKAVRFMDATGWKTRWWGVTIGQFGFGVMKRDKRRESK